MAQQVNNLETQRHEFHPWVGKIPLEEEMATHSGILAWKIPWTEKPGGLYSPWGHKGSNLTEHTQVSQVNIYNIYLHVKAY